MVLRLMKERKENAGMDKNTAWRWRIEAAISSAAEAKCAALHQPGEKTAWWAERNVCRRRDERFTYGECRCRAQRSAARRKARQWRRRRWAFCSRWSRVNSTAPSVHENVARPRLRAALRQ